MCKATELPEKKAILEDVEAPPAPASPKRAMHLLRYATWGDLGLFSLAMATVTISGAN